MTTWGAPVTIAAVSAAGILGALLTDGGGEAFCVAAAALPVMVCTWMLLTRRG